MNYEAYQSVVFPDQGNLLLPKLRGVVAKNMEERIVLRARDWKLDDVPDKVRHNCAAAAELRIEMCHIGNRQVIGELESVVPVRVAIEDARAKALCSIFRA